MKKKGLGNGLVSLFMDDEINIGASTARSVDNLAPVLIKTTMLEPKKTQPRKTFKKEALAELADSIAVHGIIQPLAVRAEKDGFYQIISGERRWRAAKMAGLDEVPVIIKDVDDLTAAEMSLVENLQREDLNPVEEAMGYKYLSDEYALTQEEIAKRVAKSRSLIANSLRILSLNEDVLSMLSGGEISAGHARALLPLAEEDQIELAEKIIQTSMSVRETERAVKNIQEKRTSRNAPPTLRFRYADSESESALSSDDENTDGNNLRQDGRTDALSEKPAIDAFNRTANEIKVPEYLSSETEEYADETDTADMHSGERVIASENGNDYYDYYTALQYSVSAVAGVQVKISRSSKNNGNSGALVINYNDSAQLEGILRKLIGDDSMDEIFQELS